MSKCSIHLRKCWWSFTPPGAATAKTWLPTSNRLPKYWPTTLISSLPRSTPLKMKLLVWKSKATPLSSFGARTSPRSPSISTEKELQRALCSGWRSTANTSGWRGRQLMRNCDFHIIQHSDYSDYQFTCEKDHDSRGLGVGSGHTFPVVFKAICLSSAGSSTILYFYSPTGKNSHHLPPCFCSWLAEVLCLCIIFGWCRQSDSSLVPPSQSIKTKLWPLYFEFDVRNEQLSGTRNGFFDFLLFDQINDLKAFEGKN